MSKPSDIAVGSRWRWRAGLYGSDSLPNLVVHGLVGNMVQCDYEGAPPDGWWSMDKWMFRECMEPLAAPDPWAEHLRREREIAEKMERGLYPASPDETDPLERGAWSPSVSGLGGMVGGIWRRR